MYRWRGCRTRGGDARPLARARLLRRWMLCEPHKLGRRFGLLRAASIFYVGLLRRTGSPRIVVPWTRCEVLARFGFTRLSDSSCA